MNDTPRTPGDTPAATPAATPEERRCARATVDALFAVDVASRSLGLELLEVAPGFVRIAMTVREDMINGFGICHGGIIFALADSAFAFACNSRGEPMVAAGASIEFLAPIPPGERLVAIARETMRGPRNGIYDIAVTKASGEPLAFFRGRCTLLRRPASPAK